MVVKEGYRIYLCRSRKMPINEYVIPKVTPQEWTSHFKSIYEVKEQAENHNIVMDDGDEGTDTIEIREVETKAKIAKLKNRKSAGLDNINNEMIKYGGDSLTKELTAFYNIIMSSGNILTEWKSSITIPIYKKRGKGRPKKLSRYMFT